MAVVEHCNLVSFTYLSSFILTGKRWIVEKNPTAAVGLQGQLFGANLIFGLAA